MHYIGNHRNWVQLAWITEILSAKGQARPRDWPPAFAVETAEYKKAETAGYDLSAINWWVYEKQDVSFDILPPWTKDSYHWWITKLMPGQFMPMHTDPHSHDRSCNRYWMPLQDYEPGHIFIYGTEMISNYRMGDVFMFVDERDCHGAANIGHSPRLMLLVTEYV